MFRTGLPRILLVMSVLVLARGEECFGAPPLAPPAGAGPIEISAGVFLLDLVDVDAADQSVEGDFVVNLSWHDPRLANDAALARDMDAIWRPPILPVQARRSLAVVWEDLGVEADGTVRLRQRYAGRLSAALNLAAFPFDHHLVRLTFTIPASAESDFRFVLDESRSGRTQSPTIADWSIVSSRANTEPFEIRELGLRRPGFGFEIGVRRNRGFYIWGVLLPLVMIIAMSWAVFWLSPTFVSQKIGIATTAILTLIAYRFALGTQLPRLSYLTRMDYFTVGATILVFLAFLKVVIEAMLVNAQREARAVSIDRMCRWGFPAALAILIYGSFGM